MSTRDRHFVLGAPPSLAAFREPTRGGGLRAVAALALVVFAVSAAAFEVSLTRVHERAGYKGEPCGSSRHPDRARQAPPGEWKLPALVSEHPVYVQIPQGDQFLLGVLDREKPSDTFYNRFYLDANGNRDLTDDPVRESTLSNEPGDEFPTANFSIAPGMDLSADLMRRSGQTEQQEWESMRVFLLSMSYYRGQFELDGQSYTLLVEDTNCNARFGDLFLESRNYRAKDQVYTGGDRIYLGPQADKLMYYDYQSLGSKLWLGGKLYTVSVADGKAVSTPSDEPTATLEVPAGVERVTVYSKDGKNCVSAFRPGASMQVPPGEYRIESYQLARADEQGDQWMLRGTGTVATPFVSVQPGNTAKLGIGEPFLPFVVSPEPSPGVDRSDREVQLALRIEGQANEVVTNLTRVKGQKTKIKMSPKDPNAPAEPKYKVIKGDGEVSTQGQFEYG